MEIKVSIVIPIYNSEEYLRQCLDTVCGQTVDELQIICVDDGSTDNSVSILKEYCERDSRIQILYHEHTGNGAAGARNMGLKYVTGEYVLFLDSDDYFELDLVEKAYKRAKETDADVVMYDANWYDMEKECFVPNYQSVLWKVALPEKEVFCAEDCPDTVFQISTGVAWSKMWKSSFIKERGIKFQEIYWADDAFFTYSAMAIAKKITVIYDKLVNYRCLREGSQTATKDKNPRGGLDFALKLKGFLQDNNLYEMVKASYWHKAIGYCLSQLYTYKSYSAFKTGYMNLKNGGLQDILDDDFEVLNSGLGLEESIKKQRENFYDEVKNILSLNIDDFMFYYYKSRNRKTQRFFFPKELVKKDEKVILYGAGVVGKTFFNQNMNFKYCQIVGWADRDYEEIGFPVCAPKHIVNLSFDKVLIAIEQKRIANSIKENLIQLGVAAEKIFWQLPTEQNN